MFTTLWKCYLWYQEEAVLHINYLIFDIFTGNTTKYIKTDNFDERTLKKTLNVNSFCMVFS